MRDTRPIDEPVAVGRSTPATPMALALLALSASGWAALLWMAVDRAHPVVQLAMPMSSQWTVANLLATWSMWAVMMAAMMLPSAMPMVLAFTRSCSRDDERMRAIAFVAAYLLIWSVSAWLPPPRNGRSRTWIW